MAPIPFTAGACAVLVTPDRAVLREDLTNRVNDDAVCSDCERPLTTTALMVKGKTMAEPHETQQEKEARWTAQRAVHDTQQNAYRAARTRKIGRNWLVVGAIVIIVAVMAAAILL
jgi:hypothetical protein